MKRFFNWKLVFFVIIFLSVILRFYALNKIPASLNPDEASLGYTAFSILKTGMDEHGKFLPLALESFGDWKLPVYSYFSTIPISVLGLNVFSTRFISALAGVLSVIFIYFIAKKLFKNNILALVSSLFFAISPWSIYFSRAAYEVNLALAFFLAGFLLVLKYLEDNKNRWLFLSLLFLTLTLFTYNSFVIFSPLFIFGVMLINWKKIKLDKISSLLLIVFFGFVLISIYSSIFQSTNKTSTLLVFNDRNTIYARVEKIRGDNSQNQLKILEPLIYNKYTGGAYQFAQNYLTAFSPSFLFDKGGEKLVDNLGYFGNLYLIDAFFILVGFAFLFLKKEASIKYLLLWLILAPIPDALTKNPLSSTRLFLLMPILVLISAYGFYQLFEFTKKKNLFNYAFRLIVVLFFVYNIALFLDGYFVHLNAQRARFWRYGLEQAVEVSQKYSNYNIVFRGPENFPYIYFLFFNKYSPTKFMNEVKYYPANNEGYSYVKSFGRYGFPVSIDYDNLKTHTIYFDDNYLRFRDKILLPSGEPILSYEVVK